MNQLSKAANEDGVRIPEQYQAWATWQLSKSVDRVARAIESLGTGNAATDMGAIEVLSMEIREGFIQLSNAVVTPK